MVLLFVFAAIFIARKPAEKIVPESGELIKPAVPGQADNMQKLTINVVSPSNAEIVLPNGTAHKLPYEFAGREGDKFDFTLKAEGYVSQSYTGIEITTSKSYDYVLEKIK